MVTVRWRSHLANVPWPDMMQFVTLKMNFIFLGLNVLASKRASSICIVSAQLLIYPLISLRQFATWNVRRNHTKSPLNDWNGSLSSLNARRMLHARTLQCGPQSISGTGISSLAFSDPTKTVQYSDLRLWDKLRLTLFFRVLPRSYVRLRQWVTW